MKVLELFAGTRSIGKADDVDRNVLRLIRDLRPNFWFIENPRGGHEKNDLDAGPPALYGDLLPVWRYPHEADGHMDQPP